MKFVVVWSQASQRMEFGRWRSAFQPALMVSKGMGMEGEGVWMFVGCEYQYTNRFHREHRWSVMDAFMGVHLHITDLGEKHGKEFGQRYSGGVEYHYRLPPEHMMDEPPSSRLCWLIGGPCWHDGTSSWATDHWIPLWLREVEPTSDHDLMFSLLRAELKEKPVGFGAVIGKLQELAAKQGDDTESAGTNEERT